jgi:histidine kinase
MRFWRQLRWQFVGATIIVVLVGVVVLAVTASLALRGLPADIQTSLAEPASADSSVGPIALDAAMAEEIMATVRRGIWQSLLIAAIAATLAGLLTSILLSREILRPLGQIAGSSKRIADGHYGERVTVPYSDELALVATNFNQMAESLEQTELQRVQMIGDVAHELRTPLTGLRGYLEGLLDGLFPPESETFGHMYQEVRRLQRLVDDLQTLSRVEAGNIELHPQRFDLVKLVERVTTQVRPQIVAESQTLVTDCNDDELLVYADPDRTAQVLVNLISNAIRYTPEGGHITVCVNREGRFAAINVIDTGVGLAPEELSRIFERFYRVDKARSRRSGGSGIGLTIAQHLAWAMGGEVTVNSEGAGKGSSFGFTLPLA